MAYMQYYFVIFLLVITQGNDGYSICGSDSNVHKMPPCDYKYNSVCGDFGSAKHRRCRTIQPFSVSSRLTSNITCIDKDLRHPSNGYLLAECDGIVTGNKQSTTKGICTGIERGLEQISSNVYLDIKELTTGKYKFNCHHKDGKVVTTEAIVFSTSDKFEELTVLVNDKPQPSHATNIMEGDSVSIIFRKFGGYDVYSSPQCHELADRAKKRIYCDFNYPCSKISRSQISETPAIFFLYSFIPVIMSDNGTTITFTNNDMTKIGAVTIIVKSRPIDEYSASSCFAYPHKFKNTIN